MSLSTARPLTASGGARATRARLVLGCIADDFTGATDLANNLVKAGMRVVQTIGTPTLPTNADWGGAKDDGRAECSDDSEHGDKSERCDVEIDDVDAIVVALKSRTIPASEAVAQSIDACRWLRARGAEQIYFKVCSTFDSTPAGNIGPVIDALLDELGADFCLVTPAFPDNGRTVFSGHLFVGDQLLSDSSMRSHPLTPMTDANLVRVLQRQLNPTQGRRVGLIDYRTIGQGPTAITARCTALQAESCTIAIADAISNADLMRLGQSALAMPLVCAGSGLAIGLPANWGIAPSDEAARLPAAAQGQRAIVCGSCSSASEQQVRRFIEAGGAARALDPLCDPIDAAPHSARHLTWQRELIDWARSVWQATPGKPVLLYSTAAPSSVQAVQRQFGIADAGHRIEQALASVARAWVEAGATQLVIAGGETAGACVQALKISLLRIGPQIDPGVPWCLARSPSTASGALHIALKSGNFGSPDFFSAAFERLGHS